MADCHNQVESGFRMEGDNMATVITITRQVTTWRSRHYALRAGWAREQVDSQLIEVIHASGGELPADGLTKIIQGTAIAKSRDLLLLKDGGNIGNANQSNV